MIYFILPFIFSLLLFPLIIYLPKQLQKNKKKVKKRVDKAAIPPISFSDKLKRLLRYSVKRQKGKEKWIFLLFIPVSALISGLLSFFLEDIVKGLIVSFILFLIHFTLLFAKVKPKWEKELTLLNKVLQIKRREMGLVNTTDVYSYTREFTVDQWEDDYPKKITLIFPPSFALENRVRFMEEFSKALGKGRRWTASEKDWLDGNDSITVTREKLPSEDIKKFIQNCLVLKEQLLGRVERNSGLNTYEYEFTIDKFGKDKKPSLLTLKFPVGTGTQKETIITQTFTEQLGEGSVWEVIQENAWDMANHELHLRRLPPLPPIAPWDWRYLESDLVDDYFFPLGLGSKNGIPMVNPKTGEDEIVVGYDPHGDEWKLLKKKGIVKGFPNKAFSSMPQGMGAGKTGGGKSVLLKSIQNACLVRRDKWLMFICDMKMVEGSRFLKYGVKVGVNREECANICTFCQKVMMDRLEEMAKKHLNNYADVPEEERGPAILLIVDEASELLAPITAKGEQGEADGQYQADTLSAIESIYRLGRAPMVHCLVVGQRISKDQGISMAIRNNAGFRFSAGKLDSMLSTMVFEDGLGSSSLLSASKGRVAVQYEGEDEQVIQGFFENGSVESLDEYLMKKFGTLVVYGDQDDLAAELEEKKEQAKVVEDLTEEELEELYKNIDEAM